MKKTKYLYVISIAFLSLLSSNAVAQNTRNKIGKIRCSSDRTIGSESAQLFSPSSNRYCALRFEFTSPEGNGFTSRFGRCSIEGNSTPTNGPRSCVIDPANIDRTNGWDATDIVLPNLANQMHPDDVVNGCVFHKEYPKVLTTEVIIETIKETTPAGDIYARYIDLLPDLDWKMYCTRLGERYCPPKEIETSITKTDYTIRYRVNCPHTDL
jgi:hypothetical protein